MKVAVSQRVDIFPDRGEIRDALDQRLIAFLRAADCVPVPVPNSREGTDAWLAAVLPQAVVLSGGNDIGQFLDRDTTESCLLDYASNHRLPVLGICRGMQMMAHRVGMGLRTVNGHVQTRHQLTGQVACEVNSYHNFALNDCPDGFEILARSEDGVIEAIRHHVLPWEGWMWHPERESAFSRHDVQRVNALFCAGPG